MSPRLATILDQALVSATGFLSMLLFARLLPPMEWAIISFAAGISLVLQGIQINSITIPMITFSHGRAINTVDQQHWTWLNRALLATMSALSALIGFVVFFLGSAWVGKSLLLAAVLLPPTFIYEYIRRRLILCENFTALVKVSFAYAAGTMAGALFNYTVYCSPLSAALSFWPGMFLAVLVLNEHDPLRLKAPPANWLQPLRGFVPSAVGSSLAGTGYNFAVLAILGAMAGPIAVAVFNATRLVMQPINTLVGAFNSLDIPRATAAYAISGKALLTAQTRAMARLAILGGSYLFVVCYFSETLLQLLFKNQYNSTEIVWSWGLVGMAMLIATPAETSLYVTHRTRQLFQNKLAASALACSLAYLLIPSQGAIGAVLSVATSVVRCCASLTSALA